ncbi:site-specific integrase [Oscillibacter sp.]|uniref:tyrosine-type recombinase/integrase n=1 Tax=Oscillibacter sp. TaxID=1945593 RepID=UPI0028B18268|nr:site-specific integrase [Oscillibacter sp.]
MSELRLKRRGERWQYSFEGARIGNKRKIISKSGFRTKGAASAAGTKAMNEYNQSGASFTPSALSVSDYLDLWMERYCKINCKPETYANYEKKIRLHIKPAIGKYYLAALTPEAVQKLINDKFNAGYSRNTLAVLKGILTGSLAYAVQPLRYLQVSPAQYVRLPSTRAVAAVRTRSAPHVYIPPEQMERIFARFPEGSSSYLPLLLGYKCGLRIGEAFGLTWDCIDLNAKTLTVSKQMLWHEKDEKAGAPGYWYFTAPKYNSVRTIEISADVAAALKREKARQNAAPALYEELYVRSYRDQNDRLNTAGDGAEVQLVMRRMDGTYINSRTMQHVSRVATQELGFQKFDYHSLRHTHATILAEKGASPKYVQHRLGHKNIQVTMQIYQHLTEKMSEDGAALLETF